MLSNRRFVCDIDVAHSGGRRAPTTPLDEPVNRLRWSLGGEFHCAVRAVANPPMCAELFGGPLAVGAERHTLHPARYDDPPANNSTS